MYGEVTKCAHCGEIADQHLVDCPVAVVERPRAVLDCHHGIPGHLICGACNAEKANGDEGDASKPSNPKDIAAFNKAPLHLVPGSFKAMTALALAEGALKYGSNNWRVAGVRASVYKSALERHMDKWWNGENCDPETGVPHLANAAACLAVLIDALAQDNLHDDRPPAQADFPHLLNDVVPEKLFDLRREFGHCKPVHWTINGGEQG